MSSEAITSLVLGLSQAVGPTVGVPLGLVIRAASSWARVAYCGAGIRRRSATGDSRVVDEKRRAVPTFNRLT